ncbi:hypothetical protein BV898_10457 [Hypsibius exemplaris]|uniref:Uncharacterized protein n=1 Tax=Hypsibius exemplaris TaxID=2072580 RepID=A0A1W0WJF4_HYPEX|nr:hypothetical protein BV898_10457 [Hypsibius exemplaris]
MAQMTTRNQDTVSSFCRYTVGVASAPCSFGNLMSACPFFGIAYSDRLKAGHAVAKEIQNAQPTNASSEQSVSRKDPKMPQLKRDSTMAVTVKEAKVLFGRGVGTPRANRFRLTAQRRQIKRLSSPTIQRKNATNQTIKDGRCFLVGQLRRDAGSSTISDEVLDLILTGTAFRYKSLWIPGAVGSN